MGGLDGEGNLHCSAYKDTLAVWSAKNSIPAKGYLSCGTAGVPIERRTDGDRES
jgi:hypothetical protein